MEIFCNIGPKMTKCNITFFTVVMEFLKTPNSIDIWHKWSYSVYSCPIWCISRYLILIKKPILWHGYSIIYVWLINFIQNIEPTIVMDSQETLRRTSPWSSAKKIMLKSGVIKNESTTFFKVRKKSPRANMHKDYMQTSTKGFCSRV